LAKPKEPCAYISLWDGDGGQRPALKGVLKFTIDDMKAILNDACNSQDADDYDQYSLDIALWEEEDGGGNYPTYKGKLTVRKPKDEEAPKKRRTTRR
jgi:hypothetical protein